MNKLKNVLLTCGVIFLNSHAMAITYDVNTFAGDGKGAGYGYVKNNNFTVTTTGFFADSDDGLSAEFYLPYGLTTDTNGNLYVVDQGNNCIRMITPTGVVSTIAGSNTHAADFSDGIGSLAYFSGSYGITADPSGNLYVADAGNNCIRMLTQSNETWTVTTIAGTTTSGHADGIGEEASFRSPRGIVYDAMSQSLFVADSSNNMIRKLSYNNQNWNVETIAGTTSSGHDDGDNTAATFFKPKGITVDNLIFMSQIPVINLYVKFHLFRAWVIGEPQR